MGPFFLTFEVSKDLEGFNIKKSPRNSAGQDPIPLVSACPDGNREGVAPAGLQLFVE